MNKADYAEYETRVKCFFENEGIANLSRISEPEQEDYPDPYFSWSPCECCLRRLGGDRVDCHGWNPTTKKICGPYSICVDCEYYAAYGRLDDTTMMEIKE